MRIDVDDWNFFQLATFVHEVALIRRAKERLLGLILRHFLWLEFVRRIVLQIVGNERFDILDVPQEGELFTELFGAECSRLIDRLLYLDFV